MEDKKITLELPLNMVQAVLNIIMEPALRQRNMIASEIERQTQNQLRTDTHNKVVPIQDAKNDKDNNKIS